MYPMCGPKCPSWQRFEAEGTDPRMVDDGGCSKCLHREKSLYNLLSVYEDTDEDTDFVIYKR